MELELPSQGNCLSPQTFGMLKQGKINFGLGLQQHCVPKNFCKNHQNGKNKKTKKKKDNNNTGYN